MNTITNSITREIETEVRVKRESGKEESGSPIDELEFYKNI